MDSNGRESPDVKNSSARSRSRSPLTGGDDRHSSSGRPRARLRERTSGGNRRSNSSAACRRVYIANIPFDAKWTDVKDLFKEKIGDVAYVQLFEDDTGKFRGCGVVELKDYSSVQKAVDVLHRYEFRGRKLVIKEDFDLERDKSGRLIPGSGPGSRERSRDRPRDGGYGGGNSDMVNFNTYGLSPQFLDSLGINGPLSSKVFIANLDFKVNAKKLSEVFKLAGKIVNIELKVDHEGNSKGHGIVEFEHPVEAVQAISMFNGQKLYQRIMSVRMDRYDGDDDPRSAKLPSGLSGLGKGLGANGQAIHLSAGMSGGGNMGMGGGAGGGGGGGGFPSAALGMMGGAGFGVNPMAAAAAAMSAGISGIGGMGLGGGLGSGLASGLGASALTGAAGLNTGGLGLGLGSSSLGSAAERGLLGSSLGGSLGGGLPLGSSSLGLGSSGTSGLNFGLGGSGSSSSGAGGLMAGGSTLASLGNSSALAAAMGNTGSSLGSSAGAYGDFGSAYERATQGGSVNTSGGGDNFGNTSSDTVQVRNLPSNYSWQNLRDRFRDVGDVRYTELKTRGTAFIRFNSERDAQRAVDLMHGTRIEGRPIEVRLY